MPDLRTVKLLHPTSFDDAHTIVQRRPGADTVVAQEHTMSISSATISEEVARLHDLHQRGALTDAEFARAKERVLGQGPAGPDGTPLSLLGQLRRSREDRWVAGVCGGIAQLTGTQAWLWRLGLALLSAFGGAGLLVYLLLWVFVPEA